MFRLIKNNWLLFVIVFLALFIRLFRIETLTSFQGDQGRDLLAVFDMIVNRKPTLLGSPSTFGPFQGPLYYYLLVPGMVISRMNHFGVLITAVAFNILGLLLLYFFISKYVSRQAAVFASFFYAFSPLFTEIGRTLLNAYFGVPFFIGSLFALIEIFIEKKLKWVLILGFLVGSMIQLHYNFAPFFLFCLILPFFFPKISKVKYYFYFLSMFFIASLPQVLFEIRHEFLNTKLLLQTLQTGKAAGSFSLSYISFFFSTLGYLFGWRNVWYGTVVFVLVGLGILGGLGDKSLKNKNRQILSLFLSCFISFLLIALLSRVKLTFPAYHYYMSIFPLFFIFASIVVYRQKKTVQFIILALFLIISFFNLDLFRNHGFTMVKNWSMIKQREASQIIANDAKGKKNWNIASVIDGDTQGLPLRYHLSTFGARDYLGVEEYPKSDILYLVTRDEREKIFDYTVWEVASLKPFRITREWIVDEGIKVYRIERQKQIQNLKL